MEGRVLCFKRWLQDIVQREQHLFGITYVAWERASHCSIWRSGVSTENRNLG